MKINILGTRANIKWKKPRHTYHSGLLVDDLILIDVGEERFLNYQPQLILITHFHPDHAFFVAKNQTFNSSVPVYAPEKHPLLPHANLIDDTLIWEGYHITPIPTIHSLNVKSQGYLVEKEDKRFFYTSDMAWIEQDRRKKLGQLDLIITDASYINSGGRVFRNKNGEIYGHTGIPDLIRLFKPHTHRIVFTHQGSWFVRDVPSGIQKIKSLEEDRLSLDVAYDGKVYTI